MWIILSTDLEITINYRKLTDDDAVLLDGTFLASDTTTNGQLGKR